MFNVHYLEFSNWMILWFNILFLQFFLQTNFFLHFILKMCDMISLHLLLHRSRLLSSFIGLTVLKYSQWSQLTIMSQNNQSINQAYLIRFLFKIWTIFFLLFPSPLFLIFLFFIINQNMNYILPSLPSTVLFNLSLLLY